MRTTEMVRFMPPRKVGNAKDETMSNTMGEILCTLIAHNAIITLRLSVPLPKPTTGFDVFLNASKEVLTKGMLKWNIFRSRHCSESPRDIHGS
jgi:hypothetical protein